MQAKHVALTYSNLEQQGAAFNKEELLAYLQGLSGVQYAMVAREEHQDGNTHFHAYVRFAKKPNIRNNRFFDYKNCHPNIQGCKNVSAWKTYVKKDGDWLESNKEDQSLFDNCRDMQLQQWIEYCIREKISYMYMDKIWNMCHVTRDNTIAERPEENYQCDALKNFQFQDWKRKSLVLYGESGCGKTNWAKWHMDLPSLFVSHLDSLKDFDSNYHRSIIFDDVCLLHLPRESQIHIVDTYDPRAIHCRYRVANIPAGIPKVFTANRRILLDDPAVNRRINAIRINGFQIYLLWSKRITQSRTSHI